mmetsp:Transcript_8142/g.32924  ORF Transcript_8142/g.32924 Transcript_8142/m.32924 type:complete len:209 (-) Transcript_8142:142-768(-)
MNRAGRQQPGHGLPELTDDLEGREVHRDFAPGGGGGGDGGFHQTRAVVAVPVDDDPLDASQLIRRDLVGLEPDGVLERRPHRALAGLIDQADAPARVRLFALDLEQRGVHARSLHRRDEEFAPLVLPDGAQQSGSDVETVRQAARGVRGGPARLGGELAHPHEEPLQVVGADADAPARLAVQGLEERIGHLGAVVDDGEGLQRDDLGW